MFYARNSFDEAAFFQLLNQRRNTASLDTYHYLVVREYI